MDIYNYTDGPKDSGNGLQWWRKSNQTEHFIVHIPDSILFRLGSSFTEYYYQQNN